MLFGSVFFIIFFIDYTLQEWFSAIKLASISIIGTLLIITSFQEDAVVSFYIGKYPSLKANGYFSIIYFLLIFIYLISVIYWTFKTSKHSPKELEKYSKKLGISAILILLGAFLFLIQIRISIVFTLSGMISIIIIIIKEPKILYILPFKSYRLIVIYKESGIDIFSHIWEFSNISDDILAGLMSVFKKLGFELIHQGELDHIDYKNGVFLVKETTHLIIGLIVSKTSTFLNKCLNKFSLDFENTYQQVLQNWHGDLNEFKDANILLEKHFGYIPSRIQK